MEETEADLVGLLYDTGHLVFSGKPMVPLHKWFDRRGMFIQGCASCETPIGDREEVVVSQRRP